MARRLANRRRMSSHAVRDRPEAALGLREAGILVDLAHQAHGERGADEVQRKGPRSMLAGLARVSIRSCQV